MHPNTCFFATLGGQMLPICLLSEALPFGGASFLPLNNDLGHIRSNFTITGLM